MKANNRFHFFIFNKFGIEIIILIIVFVFQINENYLYVVLLSVIYKLIKYLIAEKEFEITKNGIGIGKPEKAFFEFNEIHEINFYTFNYFLAETLKIEILLHNNNKIKLSCEGMFSEDDTDNEAQFESLFYHTKSFFPNTNLYENTLFKWTKIE